MKMKFQLALVAAMALQSLTCAAEGYQVNSLSAKQNGMGHTGTALKLGAESMFFNPAGMAFMNQNIDVTGTVTGIFSSATTTYKDKKYETDSDPSTPMNLMLGFRVYDNLKVGVAFYTPYGSNINWGINWPGAPLNQSVKLAVMSVQPTVSWRILPNLSVGAGLSINWGSVNLNKALIMGSSVNAAVAQMAANIPPQMAAGLNVPTFAADPLASVNLTGDAAPRMGVNLGVMWDINPQWTVGLNFRSRFNMRVKKGTASLNYAPDFEKLTALVASLPPAMAANFSTLGALNQIDQANFAAEMPCPAVYRLGVAYKPLRNLTLAFDAQLTGWNAYKQLDFAFDGEVASQFNQTIEKHYKNAVLFGLGAQYGLTERFDIRAGMLIDTTPCNPDYYNPETPGMTKVEPSVGLSFRPVSRLSIDASLLYVAGMGANNRKCTYIDTVTKQPVEFNADYKLHAICPAIGVSLQF